MPAAFYSAAQLVEPQAVMITATDGMPIHAQLFVPHGSQGRREAARR